VFELGAVYLKLIKAVPLKDSHPLDPAIYIHRFAGMMEFGEDVDKVKMDAANLVKGFKRDWLIEGRRPSGICGAALILAARMNNYRRSVAEVVQVVKIADSTLKKRLEEFQQTPAGQMSITEIRQRWELDEQGSEAFPSVAAPPIFNRHRRVEAIQAEESARAARRASPECGSSIGEASADDEDDDDSQSRRKKRKLNKGKDVKRIKRNRENSSIPTSRGGTPRADSPAGQRNSEAGPGPTTLANALDWTASVGQGEREDIEGDEDDILNNPVADQLVGEELNEALAHDDVAEALMKIEHTKEEELNNIQSDIARRPEDDPLKGLDEDELDDYICDPIEAKIKMHTWIDTNMDYLIKLQGELSVAGRHRDWPRAD
jgi:transcription factor IIIB subunit 2